MNRRTIIASAIVGSVAFMSPYSHAQENYPDRPVHMIVPAAPGGVTDMPARLIASGMHDSLGQSVVVENHGGGGGIIGVERVKKTTPDGYTLLYVNAATHGLLPALMPTIPYDALNDFIPIALVVRAPMAIVVRADSEYQTLDDLIADAVNGGVEMNYGSPGPGNTSHLIGLMLTELTETDMAPIHYQGEAPMINDLLSGELDFIASNMILSHVASGALKVLATTGDTRWFAFPDAPTLKELGHDAEFYAWSGLVAPAGTPSHVVEKMNAAVNDALTKSNIKEALASVGFEIMGGPPEQLAKIMQSYITNVREIGTRNSISLE